MPRYAKSVALHVGAEECEALKVLLKLKILLIKV